VLNRDMYLKFWHKYPSMLNTAFMSCAVDSYRFQLVYSLRIVNFDVRVDVVISCTTASFLS